MERYSEYKDSGVQWLGEIPKGWECTTMNRLLISPLQYGASESGEMTQLPDYCRYIRITDITLDGKLKDEGQKYLPKEIADEYPVEKGDLLFARSGATVGKSYLFNEDFKACFAGYLIKARLNNNYSIPAYVSYYTKSTQYDEWKNRIFIQATIQNIGADKYARLSIPLPPLSEQHSIVSFLDSKCSKIDEWISKKQKEVELLGEAKQRIIADAVTHGLNPNVKMKKTGIAWLEEVPEHWELKPIRSLLKESEEKTETGDEELLSLSQYTGITRKKDANKTGMFEAETTIGYKKVHPGQFVMNIMLAWNGSYAVSTLDGIISPAYCVFDFICDCDKMYYDYLLRTKMYSSAFKTESRGIIDSRLRLYPYKFYPFYIPVPPLSEQQAIVSYITSKTTKIDSLMSSMNKEIEHLKEYKQRLISDVVTGQIKVC